MLQCRLPDTQDRRHAPNSAQASNALVAGLSAARRMGDEAGDDEDEVNASVVDAACGERGKAR